MKYMGLDGSCGQNAESLTVKEVVHVHTAGMKMVKY